MTNAELVDKLRILQFAILNPHHRGGEYVDKRFADVCAAAADALEAATPVVMCKDCRHYDVCKNGVNGWCNEHERPTDVTYYCADAVLVVKCRQCKKWDYVDQCCMKFLKTTSPQDHCDFGIMK